MRTFLSKNGSNDPKVQRPNLSVFSGRHIYEHAYENIDGVMLWADHLAKKANLARKDNAPIQWIKDMLDTRPMQRPTASQVLNSIRHAVEGEFCGKCCKSDEPDVVSDGEDSIIDFDEEYDNRSDDSGDSQRTIMAPSDADVGTRTDDTASAEAARSSEVPHLHRTPSIYRFIPAIFNRFSTISLGGEVPSAEANVDGKNVPLGFVENSAPDVSGNNTAIFPNVPGAFPDVDYEEDEVQLTSTVGNNLVPEVHRRSSNLDPGYTHENHVLTAEDTEYKTAFDTGRRSYRSQSWTVEQQPPFVEVVYEDTEETTIVDVHCIAQPEASVMTESPITVVLDEVRKLDGRQIVHTEQAITTGQDAVADRNVAAEAIPADIPTSSSSDIGAADLPQQVPVSNNVNMSAEDATASIQLLLADIGNALPTTPPMVCDDVFVANAPAATLPTNSQVIADKSRDPAVSLEQSAGRDNSKTTPTILIHQSPKLSSHEQQSRGANDIPWPSWSTYAENQSNNRNKPAPRLPVQQIPTVASNPLQQHFLSARQPAGAKLTLSNLERHNATRPIQTRYCKELPAEGVR